MAWDLSAYYTCGELIDTISRYKSAADGQRDISFIVEDPGPYIVVSNMRILYSQRK
jgi:hypothetical protein